MKQCFYLFNNFFHTVFGTGFFSRSFCDLSVDEFCEHPSKYPTEIVGRIIRNLNNSVTPAGSNLFFAPPAPLEGQEFVEGMSLTA